MCLTDRGMSGEKTNEETMADDRQIKFAELSDANTLLGTNLCKYIEFLD